MGYNLEVLTRAKALLTRGWCTGRLAEDLSGGLCDPTEYRAVKWCLSGAIRRAAQDVHDDTGAYCPTYLSDHASVELEPDLRGSRRCDDSVCRFEYILDWNDKPGRTWQEVLCLMDRVIERVKGATL